jgi:hypothetical protein
MLLSVVNAPWFFVSSKLSDNDYSNWMAENLELEDKIIEIAMLGAHDAFSHEIDIFSPVDNVSADGLMQGFVGRLIKGFSIRQSKTQVVGTSGLLKSGVRYLDMRLSYHEEEGEYYTVHNYFSSPLTEVLQELETFIIKNPGEFIVLDIQHVYGVDYDSEIDFLEVYSYFEDTDLLDYAYPDNIKPLNEVSYGDITSSKTKGGLIILSKFTEDNEYFWDYESYVRSSWANEDEFDKIIGFLEEEMQDIILDSTYQNNFRVMQAVATMEMSGSGIARSFETWSLLGRARDFNKYLLEYEDLKMLLVAMPILMTDFTTDKETIDQFMQVIIDVNTEQ